MSDYVFGKRVLGFVFQPTHEGTSLLIKVASVADSIRRPFARDRGDSYFRYLVYAEGPDQKMKILRDEIKEHPGLREFRYECVELRRR